MRTVLLADAEGACAVPESIRERWDRLEWVCERTGTAALARVRAGVRPRLAVVNLQLPDMCGTELIERLRKGMPGLPVVAMSNSGGSLIERLARSLGVIAYLAKPLEASLIDQVLCGCLHDLVDVRRPTIGLDMVGGE